LQHEAHERQSKHQWAEYEYLHEQEAYAADMHEYMNQRKLHALSLLPFFDDGISGEVPELPLLPEPKNPGKFEPTAEERAALAAQFDPVQSPTGLLLDSWEVRRIGWQGPATRATCRPCSYQLPITATSLEAKALGLVSLPEYIVVEELGAHKAEVSPEEIDTMGLNPSAMLLNLRTRALNHANKAQELLDKDGPPPQSGVEDWYAEAVAAVAEGGLPSWAQAVDNGEIEVNFPTVEGDQEIMDELAALHADDLEDTAWPDNLDGVNTLAPEPESEPEKGSGTPTGTGTALPDIDINQLSQQARDAL
jgi:hypothetical protein